MDVSGQVHAPAAIPRWRDPPRTHWIGGWMGPRAGLDTVAKRKIPSPCRESNPDRPAHRLVAISTRGNFKFFGLVFCREFT
jgi:hypothetical protein